MIDMQGLRVHHVLLSQGHKTDLKTTGSLLRSDLDKRRNVNSLLAAASQRLSPGCHYNWCQTHKRGA